MLNSYIQSINQSITNITSFRLGCNVKTDCRLQSNGTLPISSIQNWICVKLAAKKYRNLLVLTSEKVYKYITEELFYTRTSESCSSNCLYDNKYPGKSSALPDQTTSGATIGYWITDHRVPHPSFP